MRLGVPKEIKDNENRVAMTPAGVARLIEAGHPVRVEHGAGNGCGFADDDYVSAGAQLCDRAAAWDTELVVKVKEPLESEYGFLHGQIVFTYLHLAGVPAALTEALLASRTTAVAYETTEDAAGRLPLLAPMSAVAGSMAPIVGSYHLARFNGGRGMLLGKVLGQPYGRVMIVGDGVVGRHAASVATAMGAEVYLFGLNAELGPALKAEISQDLNFVISTRESLAEHARDSDLLIGAVLVEGARAPHLISAAMVATMPKGSVIVDVSIDQGGCVETSRPTSHSEPTFVEHGVIHYCVTNMPGAYPRTSTFALTDATLPYVSRIADSGLSVFSEDAGFGNGVNTLDGFLTCLPVAEALGMQDRYRSLSEILA
ncbi:MAG: alanine dehydrogenase [Gammaproteobacteria bacterium]|nr:alanine dehydrogenase [Gammaproteobacteria bacterium]MDH3506614.1 alanine dehydrogenase [Gammaproteobacteria bacterium]